MQLKQTGIALIVAGVLSANAYAGETPLDAALPPAQPVAAFTDADLNALFEQEAGKPMQLAALSQQEMKETEGAWIWLWLYMYAPQITAAAMTAYHAAPRLGYQIDKIRHHYWPRFSSGW